MSEQIARVKAGRFEAWFDQADKQYEVSWYENDVLSDFAFPSREEAKAFWHEKVIDRMNFNYCYCCE